MRKNARIDMSRLMPICPEHFDYQVPLLTTYSFPEGDLWCPYCGWRGCMSGGRELTEQTPELKKRKKLYKCKSEAYLAAESLFNNGAAVIDRRRVVLRDMSEELKRRVIDIRNSWEYGKKAE